MAAATLCRLQYRTGQHKHPSPSTFFYPRDSGVEPRTAVTLFFVRGPPQGPAHLPAALHHRLWYLHLSILRAESKRSEEN
uniref:Uncharacterized protein n=1 Tax=Arundo donax TaxID=35708 RepID=A0A0A9G2M5_ARUDO